MRSVIKNHIPAAIALESAANTLMRTATPLAIGSIEKTRPSRTKNGLPGGCGSPSVYAAVMYSLVSHMAVEGASVTRYSSKTPSDTSAAVRYGVLGGVLGDLRWVRVVVVRRQIAAGTNTQ